MGKDGFLTMWSGFRFGLILQFSIGPVCLQVFSISGTGGLPAGLLFVAAAALVDAFYIVLAGFGAASLMRRGNVRFGIKIFGCAVLVFFGLDSILNAYGAAVIPNFALFSRIKPANIFLQGILLTASNPLTILFWGGIFSAKTAECGSNTKCLAFYGAGCVLSTAVFLSLIALLGSMVHRFLPLVVIRGLNFLVGGLMVFFGLKLILKKDSPPKGSKS